METFTRKQVAEILGIRPRTIWHYEKRGIISPAFYVNGRPRYTLESIIAIAK